MFNNKKIKIGEIVFIDEYTSARDEWGADEFWRFEFIEIVNIDTKKIVIEEEISTIKDIIDYLESCKDYSEKETARFDQFDKCGTKENPMPILAVKKHKNQYWLLDGAHRLLSLLKRNASKVRVAVYEEICQGCFNIISECECNI